MKDSCGLEITEGLYEDCSGFHYYYIKETPKGFMKKGSEKEDYSSLESSIALNLIRIRRQKELMNLVLSIEGELDEELEREIRTGALGDFSFVLLNLPK